MIKYECFNEIYKLSLKMNNTNMFACICLLCEKLCKRTDMEIEELLHHVKEAYNERPCK